ncbi:hypothetical protein [Blastococcus goldschmidtiae]|uniref:LGFP repeat-containing protein n=1 Tax=Blastococcus goldschmidtiae TaxID=3075546 RepID=A0ABU2K4J8_9ACTN|nr:hypothetical protein [Blastococcus sp. DSM 46792]MDT0275113.1 hypothetical protein [Blastococcus sp. DSM 46792]
MRPVLRVLTVLAVLAASLLAPVATSTPAQQADAADTRLFSAGNIISDAVFFDGRAMDAGQIQRFLESKSPSSCPDPALDSSPCLEDFRLDTTSRAADGLCAGYQGAARESAAQIIAKVSVSCRVSPRVILVLLQKEMGFITSSNPTAKMYDRAAGYYCPDIGTGWCHPDYAGLQKQLYNAARQYQRYAAYPANYSYRAGYTNTIQWDVPTSCGTSQVFIQNQATAGLYNYTPYRPNQAALDAGYGTGNDCSAYGNRNFWLYFTDWFGSTQSPGGAAIAARAALADAVTIGSATSGIICGLPQGGCFRAHQKGAIYWSPNSGARIVWGAIQARWGALGWETGRLGYPTGEESCGLAGGGCFQDFQNGAMYWSPATGAHPVLGSIQKKWASTTWETGYLGYPTAAERCGLTAKGCYQQYQGGRIYWSSASGAHAVVPGPMSTFWTARGNEKGSLGYPTGDQTCGLADNGCSQSFQKGTVFASAAHPARIVSGAVLTKYAATKAQDGVLGYPTGNAVCGLADKGCFQTFAKGAIYTSAGSGAWTVLDGPLRTAWAAQRWETGRLGYPTADQVCGADGRCLQQFQGGVVYSSPGTATRIVGGPIYEAYATSGREKGRLGFPTSAERCGLGGGRCNQYFEGGIVIHSPITGTHVVSGEIRKTWLRAPALLGYPIGAEYCGLVRSGCLQKFERGSVYSSPTAGTHAVKGPIFRAWGGQRWELGQLGYPKTGESCGLAGGRCRQYFEGGIVIHSPTTGTHVVWGAIGRAWLKAPAPLGYPTRGEVCGLTQGGCFQDFQKGHFYWSPTTGAHAVSGRIFKAWAAQRWETGTLGYPTEDAVVAPTTITQRFQGGTLVEDRTTGQVARK